MGGTQSYAEHFFPVAQHPQLSTELERARPSRRAPRPKSWPPALPPDRVPIPPPPLSGSAIATVRVVAAQPIVSALPDEDVALVDEDVPGLAHFLPMRLHGVGWFLLVLITVTGSLVIASLVRPDLTDRMAASVSALVAPSRRGPVANSAPFAAPPVSARPIVVPVSAKGNVIASAEPPLVSVWALPVVHVGLPPSATQGFHVPAAPLPPRTLQKAVEADSKKKTTESQ